MEREIFARRFHEASARARDFARDFIEEPLADAMLFRVRLNQSHDGGPLHADERVFPEDGSVEIASRLSRCTGDEVVDVLWRDGAVPEWVNLSVIGEIGGATLVEVVSCGRFTATERLLYHQEAGRPPFHVLGPTVPAGWETGRFSLYDRCEHWSREELASTWAHAAKVWSLRLCGGDFDDDAIASLPVLERMHVLELAASGIDGRGLAELGRQPALRHLRIDLSGEVSFTAEHLPELPHLATLTIEGLPAGRWGFRDVVARATGLERLSLATEHDLVLDGRVRRALDSIGIRARSIDGDPLPEKIGWLSLQLRGARDGDVERLLARVREVTHLSLRGTPVSEGFVESIVSRWGLEYLDVEDTQVGEECVRRVRARYPRLRTRPKPARPKAAERA